MPRLAAADPRSVAELVDDNLADDERGAVPSFTEDSSGVKVAKPLDDNLVLAASFFCGVSEPNNSVGSGASSRLLLLTFSF